MMLVAKRNSDNSVVNKGDIISTKDGEKAIFLGPTRKNHFVLGGGKSGKVEVKWVDNDFVAEYYDKVFDLTVYEE